MAISVFPIKTLTFSYSNCNSPLYFSVVFKKLMIYIKIVCNKKNWHFLIRCIQLCYSSNLFWQNLFSHVRKALQFSYRFPQVGRLLIRILYRWLLRNIWHMSSSLQVFQTVHCSSVQFLCTFCEFCVH